MLHSKSVSESVNEGSKALKSAFTNAGENTVFGPKRAKVYRFVRTVSESVH